MMAMLQTLTCIFGALTLLALIASGFTMMFSPATGRQVLKNTFTAIGMFVIASMLLQAACGFLLRSTSREPARVRRWKRWVLQMNLESMLARALNRRSKSTAARPSGLYLGTSQTLIGDEQRPFSMSWNPPQHTFISGRTGTGKTKLLLKIMAEYHRAGIPFLFIDLHGQATDELLGLIASKGGSMGQDEKIVLIEPWADPVCTWNPLETQDE